MKTEFQKYESIFAKMKPITKGEDKPKKEKASKKGKKK